MTLLLCCVSALVGYAVGKRRAKALRRLLLETIEENNNLRFNLMDK